MNTCYTALTNCPQILSVSSTKLYINQGFNLFFVQSWQAEGLNPEEAALVIQKFWGRHKRAKEEQQQQIAPSPLIQPSPKRQGAPTKRGSTPLSSRMSDLIMFSEQASRGEVVVQTDRIR